MVFCGRRSCAPDARPSGQVKEDEKCATIWVMRKDGCSADVSCSYRTEDGTAIAGPRGVVVVAVVGRLPRGRAQGVVGSSWCVSVHLR